MYFMLIYMYVVECQKHKAYNEKYIYSENMYLVSDFIPFDKSFNSEHFLFFSLVEDKLHALQQSLLLLHFYFV